MPMPRRSFLQAAGHVALYGALLGDFAKRAWALTPAEMAGSDPDLHLLRRISFGPTVQELERVRSIGRAAYVEEQLAENDVATDLAALALYPRVATGGSAIYLSTLVGLNTENHVADLQNAMLYKAIFSSAQLREVMVDFWTDHFSTYIRKNPIPLRLDLDRDVIRPQALGNFKTLLRSTVYSAEMLNFLDNWQNTKESVNENYARELLELHSLGKDGGYSEADMKALARILTGLGYHADLPQGLLVYGGVHFRPHLHDQEEKIFLGQVFPAGGGEEEINRALDLILDHPGTANFIATKLCRRFVSDEPPASLVSRVAAAFTSSNGDIKTMLRVLLNSVEFAAAAGQKIKRPIDAMVSAARACGVNKFDGLLNLNVFGLPLLGGGGTLRQGLNAAGQLPYGWLHPNGYPDTVAYWNNTNAALHQQRFAVTLVESLVFGRILARPLRLLRGDTLAWGVAEAKTPRQAVNHAIDNLLFMSLPQAAVDAAVAAVSQDADPDAVMNRDALHARVKGLVFVLLSSPWFLTR